jgi:conserved hypothetical protein
MIRRPHLPGVAAFLLALLPSVSAFAAPIAAESQIRAVTVYADRAVVTRTGEVRIPAAGVVEILFERLPAGLVDESLQVTGRGQAGAALLDVTPRTTFVDFTPNDRVKALEDEIRALDRQDREFDDRANVLAQQRDYIVKIQTSSTTTGRDAHPITAPDIWLKMLDFTEQKLGEISAEVRTLDARREELRIRRAALQQQLDQLRGGGGRSYKTVAIRLDAQNAGALELTLRYTVHGAYWTPNYDVRVSTTDRSARLGYFGLVRQQTGEDWPDVELTLSTARPSLGGAAPELQPWIVQQRPFLPVATAAPAPGFDASIRQGALKVGQASTRFSGDTPELANFYTNNVTARAAAVETHATSASFKVAVASTIPSDNSPQKVPIATATLALAPEYRTTPKLQPAAFLTAKVTNSTDYPLLAGSMNVFLDDTFVASSTLRTVMPREQFDLALGADDGLSVKRTLNNRFTEDTGVMSKSKRVTYDLTLTLQNNKRTPAKIVVRDQLPVSRHEKIVVKQLAPDERQLKPDAEGVLQWTLDLQPGEKRELPLRFSIEHPADFNVEGLE